MLSLARKLVPGRKLHKVGRSHFFRPGAVLRLNSCHEAACHGRVVIVFRFFAGSVALFLGSIGFCLAFRGRMLASRGVGFIALNIQRPAHTRIG